MIVITAEVVSISEFFIYKNKVCEAKLISLFFIIISDDVQLLSLVQNINDF